MRDGSRAPKTGNRRKITVHLDTETGRALEARVGDSGRSLSSIAGEILRVELVGGPEKLAKES